MHLYRTSKAIILKQGNNSYQLKEIWDTLINRQNLYEYLLQLSTETAGMDEDESNELINNSLLPPIGSQEVWAAGVTYLKSRDARMEESKGSGGASFYDKVYEADRTELFFKSQAHRVAAHGEKVYIRRDSSWNVPEPELTLYI